MVPLELCATRGPARATINPTAMTAPPRHVRILWSLGAAAGLDVPLSSRPSTLAPSRAQAAAPWFPDAALGLFLHWDPSSVKGINIGWSVIPGRRIAARREKFTPEEVQRIVRDDDYNLE